MVTKIVNQYIIDCETMFDFNTPDSRVSQNQMSIGLFVFVFRDEDIYRAVRGCDEDELFPFFQRLNNPPIGYGHIVGINRVAMTLFDGMELIDNGTQ